MNLEVKIKRIHDDALLPMQANPGDAGMDLYSIEQTMIPSGEAKLIQQAYKLNFQKEQKHKFVLEVALP